MIISVDYDQTYSSDPEAFNLIIKLFQNWGHTVICTTGRGGLSPSDDEVRNSIGKLVPVVFAGKEWKRDAALAAGYSVDIWIDDMPEMVARQVLLGGGWSSD